MTTDASLWAMASMRWTTICISGERPTRRSRIGVALASSARAAATSPCRPRYDAMRFNCRPSSSSWMG
jgi:hypothetical protein